MRERDDEGRPIATRNAGAFLAPVGGVVPAPSSMLDEDGGPSERDVDPRLRGRLRVLTLATAIAAWAILSALFRYFLAATEPDLRFQPAVLGEQMTHWMHTEWAWLATNVVLITVGVVFAVRRMPGRTRLDWLLIGFASATGAVLLGLVIAIVGGYSAAILAGIALAWLVAMRFGRQRLL